MEYLDNKGKQLSIITSLVYLGMVALCAFGIWKHGVENMPGIYVLNVSIEIFAILTGYMLFISCITDVQKSGTDLKWFIYLLNVTIWWAFTDAGSWLLDGVASLRVLNIIDNTILFLCTPFSAYCFWKYLTGQL